MRITITRGAALLVALALFLFGNVTAFAAEAETTPAPDTLNALHNPVPPAYPAADTGPGLPGAAGSDAPADPPSFTEAEPLSELESAPEYERVASALYPSDVRGVLENGIRWIIKTYELGADESPDGIDRENFRLDGWRYDLTDILKNETIVADTREHAETVTINTGTNNTAEIIPMLKPTLEYASADGYAGTLALDIASIRVESAGTKTSNYTVSTVREYPHLSDSDTSLIPKTITEGGRTLTLAEVDWRAQNTETVDYEAMPAGYTAIAAYTAAASKTVVTGYVTTAEYNGTLVKPVEGNTVYTAYFIGTSAGTESESRQGASIPLPAAAGTAAGAGLLGGAVFFFFLRRNVKVLNLKDGKYVPVGRTRTTAKNPVIDLTTFADKAVSGSFLLSLDAPAAKSLSGKTVTVNYGDRSLRHIIVGDGGEYQFEVDF
jgi:hypothetical protein